MLSCCLNKAVEGSYECSCFAGWEAINDFVSDKGPFSECFYREVPISDLRKN